MNEEASPSPFSQLGERFARRTGIEELMDDLGRALAAQDETIAMLGGGNPAPIPEAQSLWRELMQKLIADEPARFDRMMGNYDPYQGNRAFLHAVRDLFNRTYGWNLAEENFAVTNGGQTAFFYLFNLLSGPDTAGTRRRILFPLSPEYIGYSGQNLAEDAFLSIPARIEIGEDPFFRYHVDFDALPKTRDIAAACVSRPTNPTGNVLSIEEVRRLHRYCREREALLILDNAYGVPFPNMIFRDEEPFWEEGVVLTYSLSKLGLPGTRTGIVIGPPEICRAVSSLTAVAGLANGTIGQALTLPLFQSGEILPFCRNVIRPYYESRAKRAVAAIQQKLDGLPYRIHRPDGALFLWLWFPELPIHSSILYQRLRDAGVLVVPGHHFFHSLQQPWKHAGECIRINYAMDIDSFPAAAQRMADVIRSTVRNPSE